MNCTGKGKSCPTCGNYYSQKRTMCIILSCEIAQFVLEQLDIQLDCVRYYTDSKVILCYISNNTRRFYVYVANRVEKIRKCSHPEQWNYVPTDQNPADAATRSINSSELATSSWLNGPKQLLKQSSEESKTHELVLPEEDTEIRSLSTIVSSKQSTTDNSQLKIGIPAQSYNSYQTPTKRNFTTQKKELMNLTCL